MNTTLQYLLNNARETMTDVTALCRVGESEDDDRPAVVMRETVLQHETHDRLGDLGWIDDEPILHVSRSRVGQILHHIDGRHRPFKVGQRVQVKVDSVRRNLQSRLLAAGRLIELVGPLVFPDFQAVAADFRPTRAKVDFGAPEYIPSADSVWKDFRREIDRILKLDPPITFEMVEGAGFRRVRIGDFPSVPCSGVYPLTVKAIGGICLINIVALGGRLQVRFRVSDESLT